MGREARCACRWGDRAGSVTALLEPTELIVRGAIRKRVARAALEDVVAEGETLAFSVDGERIELVLGAPSAQRWATAIATPPPTLARKLGIGPATRVFAAGTLDDDAIRAALREGATVNSLGEADLAVIRCDDLTLLAGWIDALVAERPIPPAWFVYVKGRDAPLGESRVREGLRHRGFIDTKIAAVSDRLTALKFIQSMR